MSQYIDDLQPLNDVIKVVFEQIIISDLDETFTKYKENFMKSKTSRNEFSLQIKKYVKNVLESLSTKYRKKLLSLYFSQEGLIMLVLNNLTNIYVAYYQEKIEIYKSHN